MRDSHIESRRRSGSERGDPWSTGSGSGGDMAAETHCYGSMAALESTDDARVDLVKPRPTASPARSESIWEERSAIKPFAPAAANGHAASASPSEKPAADPLQLSSAASHRRWPNRRCRPDAKSRAH